MTQHILGSLQRVFIEVGSKKYAKVKKKIKPNDKLKIFKSVKSVLLQKHGERLKQ